MFSHPIRTGTIAAAGVYLLLRALRYTGPDLGVGDPSTAWPTILVAGAVGAAVLGASDVEAPTKALLGRGYLAGAGGCIAANGILVAVVLLDWAIRGGLFSEGLGTAGFLVLITFTTGGTLALYSLAGAVLVAPVAVIAAHVRRRAV